LTGVPGHITAGQVSTALHSSKHGPEQNITRKQCEINLNSYTVSTIVRIDFSNSGGKSGELRVNKALYSFLVFRQISLFF
jgi:hypothetical protein